MTKRPNLILFNPDQWRADMMGHFGNPAASTPFLDRLVAGDAVSFRNAFCQNPVCTPSRCSFMTGLYPHVRGHRTMYHMLHSEHGETNLLAELRRNGYFVWWGGKNDLIPGNGDFSSCCNVKFHPDREFLERHNIVMQPDSHQTAANWRGEPGGDNYYSFFRGRLETADGSPYRDSDWCNVLGAIDFIRSYRGPEPYCVFLPLGYPHPPYAVEEPFAGRIDRKLLPPRLRGPRRGEPIILEGIRERQNLTGWSEERWDELRAIYYGMCARLDRQFEMIVEALKERGDYDESALFLFSDHGDFTGDYGLVEKTQNTFEDCLTNVPLIVKPPKSLGCRPGVRQALVELVDLSETVYDLAGIDPGYDRFGKSLLPLLGPGPDRLRDAVFCEGGRLTGETQAMELDSSSARDPEGLYWPRCSLQCDDSRPWHGKAVMCRTATMKYVCRLYEKDEFYDLEKDPGELCNRIDDPACAEAVARLRERLLRWTVETADTVPRTTDPR